MEKRIKCEYSLEDQLLMKVKKEIVMLYIKRSILEKKYTIFENQEIIASNVVSLFKNRKIINVMVVSKTQSGKTGSMCATIKQYLEDSGNLIHIENIYIITGLSSCEWKEQTKERIPDSMQNRVFHRCELPKTFADEIKNKKNILIIMDEIHVAAKEGQTIYTTFRNAGILNKSILYNNDIKILEYTATPDGTIYDLMKWNEASFKILGEAGDGYISSFHLLQNGRVRQYKDLYGYDKKTGIIDDEVYNNIQEIKNDIENYNYPLYHFIRTNNGVEQKTTIENFKKIFYEDDYQYMNYDGDCEIKDINKILSKKPKKHTFIFIKEMLRCAKTLKKEFIGILYDRYVKNPDDSTVIQGLVGRDTGYDNNGISICYTNIDSIKKYEELWNSNFEDKTVKWTSKTTKFTKGILSGSKTFNDPKNYDGFSIPTDDTIKEPIINIFKTQEEAKDYYNRELKEIMKGRGPIRRKADDNGYYLSTIGKGVNRAKIRTTKEIYEVRKWALNNTHLYTFYPCYEDINDKSTLQWWFIHY